MPIGTTELVVLLVVGLLCVGATQLPRLWKNAGPRHVRLRKTGRWTWSDWALVAGTVTLGLVAAALSAHAHW